MKTRNVKIKAKLIIKYPEFEASARTIKAYKQAIKEKSTAVKVKGDIGKFLEDL